MLDNAFLEVSNVETAQKLSDRVNPEGLYKIPDIFTKHCHPIAESLSLIHTCIVQQIKYAADIMFKRPNICLLFMMVMSKLPSLC